MKNLLACLALCASLSASAQGDNCTVLGIQDLTQMVFELQAQLNAQDATMDSLQNASMTRDSVRAIARGEAAFWGSVRSNNLAEVRDRTPCWTRIPTKPLKSLRVSPREKTRPHTSARGRLRQHRNS